MDACRDNPFVRNIRSFNRGLAIMNTASTAPAFRCKIAIDKQIQTRYTSTPHPERKHPFQTGFYIFVQDKRNRMNKFPLTAY